MRLPGTLIEYASWFWLMPISLRNSSFRISPGWGLWSCVMMRSSSFANVRLVVVHNLDVRGVSLGPSAVGWVEFFTRPNIPDVGSRKRSTQPTQNVISDDG